MATNIKSLGLLRNGKVYQTKSLAKQALTQTATNDGVAKLARYLDPVDGGQSIIRTLVGFYANAAEMEDAGGGKSSYTILDIDGSSASVEELRQEIQVINGKIGDGIDGTTLTIAINDINAKIGKGFDSENTVADAIANLATAMTLTLTSSTSDPDFARVYTLTQGSTEVGKINIPKDMVVEYAELVNGTWSGDTFIPDQKGKDKAIKIVFANKEESTIYVNVTSLIDVYYGGNGIDIVNNTVSIKIDGDSEAFLTVGENGLKLDGVQQAIDDAIEAAKLHESDGIKILANNKIKAYAAATIGDGIMNPIFVDAEGIKLNKELDMGFYDYQTVVNDIPSAADASTSNVVLTDANTIATLTSNTKYNSLFVSNAKIPSSDIKLNAKNITVDNVVINGNKGATNGKIIFNTPNMSIDNVEVESGSTAYNVFEGSQATADTANFVKNFNASNVTVDNTMLTHNVFNVYTVADNAVITIKDSYFNLDVDKSNILRMANYGNATGVTINFENITWTYENADKSDIKCAGLMIFQPANNDVALNGDTSKIATWKINVKDCIYNGVKVNANNFGFINQVAYLYNIGNSGAITDASSVMTMTFE